MCSLLNSGAQAKDALGQFALYVDSTLDSGMSRPIATFGNVPLSGEQKFQVGPRDLSVIFFHAQHKVFCVQDEIRLLG